MIRLIFRPIREGLIGFFRHFATTLSSVAVVVFTMLFLGSVLIVTDNIVSMTRSIESGIEVWVSVKKTNENEINNITTTLNSLEFIDNVEFISKDQELENYIKEQGEEYSYLKGDQNPFLNSYIIKAKNANELKQIKDVLSQMPWVDQIRDGGEGANNLIKALQLIRFGGSILVVSLCLLTVFLISNTIKLSIFSRQTEIEIMRIVGATNHFIRSPFLVEGVLIGLFGAIIPIALIVGVYLWFYYNSATIPLFNVLPIAAPMPLLLNVSLVILLLSMMIGFLGSFISVTRYLRWVR